MPHRDREDRIYTVILGVFYIGIGDEFDANKLQACPPDAVIVLPAEYSAFLRGKIRRVHHTSNSHRDTGVGLPQRERRSAKRYIERSRQ